MIGCLAMNLALDNGQTTYMVLILVLFFVDKIICKQTELKQIVPCRRPSN